eukprot:TRINITY_DN5447_c0_g1_i1.p1 TRINITY_DN5447_c0_g1~~TRINITY_DN5447_c0_g1_i1.p1  ORF type:complete len:876 (-),score=248.01 TRINITY_DN5447_c0_g1_i1:1879-4506(-)
MSQWVYYFGEKGAEAKSLLGGKGANLGEMTRIGLPVPAGFTITTEACIAFQKEACWPAGLKEQVNEMLAKLEAEMGKKLGDAKNPLLVSVRSGAKISMPGMMDTVLNLGLNEDSVAGMAKLTGNERFAMDSYRRFIQMFGDVVMGVDHAKFEAILEEMKESRGVEEDTKLTGDDLKELIVKYKALYKEVTGSEFPTDPHVQLEASINAVFKSWNNSRAITYRNLHGIPHDLGTAVNVQSMVFGNMGDDCATGVGFTRNPSTGECKRYGEYLINAQGEDVVAGIRTPKSIEELAVDMPTLHKELMDVFEKLELHYKDMQDIEFTIERGKLYLLQTRNGKRTAAAAVKIAVDMVAEGMIDKEEAVMRVTPEQIDLLLHKQIDSKAKKNATLLAKGLPASPGGAVGEVVFTADAAVAMKKAGKKVILARLETSPEDIEGMVAAEGILTARGGMTSHAAVVARGMNKTCVAGCSAIRVSEAKQTIIAGDVVVKVGDIITLDGATGEVFLGALPVIDPDLENALFMTILEWGDEMKTLGIRTNADTPADCAKALQFGARGVGLTRTEHMFFMADRIKAVREMILARDLTGRKKALAKLLPIQRGDFEGIFTAMNGLPVIIRLIDPPLHEFLPHELKEQEIMATELGITVEEVKNLVESMKEFNPMLGFRGCRLGLVYPEINEMQVRAIFEAALNVQAKGIKPLPEIEIPLVGNVKEFLPLKELTKRVAKETGAEGKIEYHIGTMIEVPRAALTADEFAVEADFMSFGTNDLTQMTCGFSRDDSGSFLNAYASLGIYPISPFESIDQTGVGKLMDYCVKLARSVNPNIDIGICGEHGGDPESVMFCHRIGLDNVSCSPWRVPIARISAAQAAIMEKRAAKK